MIAAGWRRRPNQQEGTKEKSMAIIAKRTGEDFKPVPAGVHTAVCCDVVDLGLVQVTYDGKTKEQHKIRIIWEIDEEMDDGRRFSIGKRYTNSLSDQATLRKDLESWRGRQFTEAELNGFDLEKLIGISALVNVTHATREGKNWADVSGVMPLAKNMQKLTISREYVRVKDRAPQSGAADPGSTLNGITDDDVPF
jgi:hypothetical protein